MTFDNGPVNLLDPDTIEQLGAVGGRIETNPDLTAVSSRGTPSYLTRRAPVCGRHGGA